MRLPFALLVAGAFLTASAADRPPDIVWIIAPSEGLVRAPESVRYSKAFSVSEDAATARETLLKGVHAVSTRPRPEAVPSVVELLREAGYDTSAATSPFFLVVEPGDDAPTAEQTRDAVVFTFAVTAQESLQIPLAVRFPEGREELSPAAAGGSVSRLVSLVDLAPTALSLAGVRPPEHMQGQAFLGDAAGFPPQYLYGYTPGKNASVRDGRFKYVRRADGGEQVFDLREDPEETNDLARDSRYAGVVEKLGGAYRRWAATIGAE